MYFIIKKFWDAKAWMNSLGRDIIMNFFIGQDVLIIIIKNGKN